MVYTYGLIAEFIGNTNVTDQAYTDQFKNPKYITALLARSSDVL